MRRPQFRNRFWGGRGREGGNGEEDSPHRHREHGRRREEFKIGLQLRAVSVIGRTPRPRSANGASNRNQPISHPKQARLSSLLELGTNHPPGGYLFARRK